MSSNLSHFKFFLINIIGSQSNPSKSSDMDYYWQSWNLVLNLTEWQKSELSDLNQTGIECLVSSWNAIAKNPLPEPHCNATWDEIYCWPPTPAGQTVKRPCSEVMKDDVHMDASNINASAYRICTENGTWLWDHWTNYNDCISAVEDRLRGIKVHVENLVIIKDVIRYILFFGSILSLASLCVSLFIYYYFKSVRCSRVTVQVHLMLSLALRYVLLIVISEPYVFNRTTYHYRSINWFCKMVLAIQFYAKIASINWMFVQGHYLHARLTTNVFNRDRLPLFKYCTFGWGVPSLIVAVWSIVMELNLESDRVCWQNYGQERYIWIIIGPLLAVLSTNIAFLANILRIMLTKIQITRNESDLEQIRRAIKATCFLSPLMGLNFLIFLPNPGGTSEAYYMLINAIIQTMQGLLVSVLYCFISKDVNDAIRRHYNRRVVRAQNYQSSFTIR